MIDFHGRNITILDLECAKSPDDCRYCDRPQVQHDPESQRCPAYGSMDATWTRFEALGWANKPALGLSIGACYAYQTGRVFLFDTTTLENLVRSLVAERPLLVTFAGITFDLPLMRGLLRQRADVIDAACNTLDGVHIHALCDTFKAQTAGSYDILAAVRKASPAPKGQGLHTLRALCQANGLGDFGGGGAEMPNLWQAGRVAEVINHCIEDIYATKALFELILTQEGRMKRGDGAALTVELPLHEALTV